MTFKNQMATIIGDVMLSSAFMAYAGSYIYDLHVRKTKTQISCAVTAQLICAFVFAVQIVLFLFYIYPKFQASSFMLSLYSLVCVGPGRKPKLLVFSYAGSYLSSLHEFKG